MQVPEHGSAMVTLIQKRGGLGMVKMPGLAGVLAFSDILAATSALTKPVFPCYWHDHLRNLLKARIHAIGEDTTDSRRGHSFRQMIPSGLPDEAATAFTNLRLVDLAMDRCRTLQLHNEELRRFIVGARNCVHHHLLSLPSWDKLNDIDHRTYDKASCECCRLTVLLYSVSVLFPMPPQHTCPELLQRLVAQLSPATVSQWARSGTPFLLWVLVVGGTAALHTPHRPFFLTAMNYTLHVRKYQQPKPVVHSALLDFLWTESACGRGFDAFWAALNLDGTGDSAV